MIAQRGCIRTNISSMKAFWPCMNVYERAYDSSFFSSFRSGDFFPGLAGWAIWVIWRGLTARCVGLKVTQAGQSSGELAVEGDFVA
jgi:hypothetical protein